MARLLKPGGKFLSYEILVPCLGGFASLCSSVIGPPKSPKVTDKFDSTNAEHREYVGASALEVEGT